MFLNKWIANKSWHLNLDFDICYRSFQGPRYSKERSDQSEHDAGKTSFFLLVNVKKEKENA